MDSDGDDYELTGSEYDEEEREILEDLRKQRKNRQEQDPRQEVLAFSDDDDDDDGDEDVAELMRDSDIEGAEDEDGDLPNTMDWGSKRSTYYNTDFVDQDYSSYNAQEEEQARAEEEEAKKIQLRLAKRLSEADFQLDDVQTLDDDDDDGDVSDEEKQSRKPKSKTGIRVTSDLTGLSARERLQLLQKDSPEFIGLTQDFQRHLTEVRDLITPVLNYARNHGVPMVPALQFASTYHIVLTTYCSNVAFYLLLKARRISVKHHPVVKRLVQLKQLRDQLTPRYEMYIKSQLEALLERIQDGDAFTVLDVAQRKAKLQILNKYSGNGEVPAELSDDEEPKLGQEKEQNGEKLKEEEEYDDDEEAVNRRGITYQMAKNKGLTPHRKKELRNPRVKHRGKYRKALIRRKGAVRTVRKETKRYGGEMSGIKATVSKSVKFRT